MEALQKQLTALEEKFKQLESSNSIPYSVGEAFKVRLNNLSLSTRTAASKTQSVNESGSSSYSVCKAPAGFITVNINGINYDLAYFS